MGKIEVGYRRFVVECRGEVEVICKSERGISQPFTAYTNNGDDLLVERDDRVSLSPHLASAKCQMLEMTIFLSQFHVPLYRNDIVLMHYFSRIRINVGWGHSIAFQFVL